MLDDIRDPRAGEAASDEGPDAQLIETQGRIEALEARARNAEVRAENAESWARSAEARAHPDEKEKSDEDQKQGEAKGSKPEDKGEDKKDAEQAKDKAKRGFLRQHPLAVIAGVIAILVLGFAGFVYYDYASHFESTDDAFIASRPSTIAPKVTGYIETVPVTDNQHVETGDVLAQLDDRDYKAALAQAKAQVASSQAQVANVVAQQDVQRAQIESSKAQVAQAQAALEFAKQQAARYDELAKRGAGSVQNAEQYSSQLGQQDASVKSAQAAEHVAERQLESLSAQKASAEASVGVSIAQLDQAQLNESYTTVRAAEPGRVVNLTAAAGEFAQPGTGLATFVPDEIWIVANFKETQLDAMRPGQKVSIEIDAYPERKLDGHVESIQPGSGTAFSLLPAQNATGNYVKVVQRVPVKIVFDHPPADVALGPGMSVVPTVRVHPKPSYYEKWRGDWNDYWSRR